MFPLLLALFGGVLIYLSQPPRRLAPLQIPGLALFLWALQNAQSPALCGLLFALGQVVPTLWQLRLHPILSGVLAFSQSVLWVCFALSAAAFLTKPTPFTPFFVAGAGAALTWLEWTILPLWGTTQAWSRPWARVPQWSRFVALTGIAGAPFALLFLVSCLILAPKNSIFAVMLFDFIALMLWFGLRLTVERPVSKLQIAVFGWAGNAFDGLTDLDASIRDAVSEAASAGAQIVVLPEAAFHVENRAVFRQSIAVLATQNHIALAIGYFDTAENRNCIDFVSASGEIAARYVKTHLVPVFERYTRGIGETATFEIGGAKVGGLICQDDNFPDIAARYSREKTQLLAIPTNDWRAVKDFHFVGALWRALEFRCALAIAASDGISAIVDGKGRVLASCDHFLEGPKLLVAEVEILRGQTTLAARSGQIFPILCGLLALVGFFFG